MSYPQVTEWREILLGVCMAGVREKERTGEPLTAEQQVLALWELLDDIDTAMDAHKVDMTRSFNQWLSEHLKKRFEIWSPE